MQTYLVLNDLRSALNVGAILRTADAIGVSKVYLCGITPTPTHPKVAKTALGADKMVDWHYRKSALKLINHLKGQGIEIAALELTLDAINIWECEFDKDIAIVVGNEVTGVSRKILEFSDRKIFLPMFGQKESLNVATATGIALFEIKRRTFPKKGL